MVVTHLLSRARLTSELIRSLAAICWLTWVGSGASFVLAQSTASENNAVESKAAPPTAEASEIQARVEAFVQQHQPRLARLLEHMKERGEGQYKLAVRDLNRSIQRLENFQKRDPELYTIELQLWKIRSQLRLQAAEIAVKPPKDIKAAKDKLQRLLEREWKQDLARLQLLRARTAAELAKFDEQIEQRSESKAELLEKSLKAWENKIKKQRLPSPR